MRTLLSVRIFFLLSRETHIISLKLRPPRATRNRYRHHNIHRSSNEMPKWSTIHRSNKWDKNSSWAYCFCVVWRARKLMLAPQPKTGDLRTFVHWCQNERKMLATHTKDFGTLYLLLLKAIERTNFCKVYSVNLYVWLDLKASNLKFEVNTKQYRWKDFHNRYRFFLYMYTLYRLIDFVYSICIHFCYPYCGLISRRSYSLNTFPFCWVIFTSKIVSES